MRPRDAIVPGVAVLVVVALASFLPWLLADRTARVSTPSQLAGEVYELALQPGVEACLDSVAFTPATGSVLLRPIGGAAGPLAVTARSGRWSSRTSVAARGGEVFAPIRPPERDVLGDLCVRNRGAEPVSLAGTTDIRAQARGTTRIGDLTLPGDFVFELYEPEGGSIAARLGTLFDRAAVWHPGGSWLLWLLTPLVLVGLPIALLRAFGATF